MKNLFKRQLSFRPPLLARIGPLRPSTPAQKGYAFEQFVVSMFDTDNFFTLLEWRSDKSYNRVAPLSNSYPDLEFEFELKRKCYPFAVECKYRESLPGNRIEWAEWHHLQNYNEFANKREIPVFIVLGFGGNAMSPKELYCIPLLALRSIVIDKVFLLTYRHENLQNKFYLDFDNMILK